MSNKVFIIAEVGPNHNGSVKKAIQLVKKLSNTGVDCVKFQLGNPYKVYSKNAFMANYQKKNDKSKSIFEMAKKYQLKHKDHKKIANLCKKKGLIYACTAFDLESLKYLDKTIKVPFFKIASGEFFSSDMIDYIKEKKKPIFISTGMANFNDIQILLRKLKKIKKNITLLHCVSSYPAKKDNLNLNVIDNLKSKFKLNIGYSDHSLGDEACLAAVAKGAKVIEKHVTTSRNLSGPDHKTSSTINELKLLVKKIRDLEIILGNNNKRFSKEEKHIHKVARKSVVSKKKIPKGNTIKMDDLCFKRPGTGFSPFEVKKILGKKAKINISENVVILKRFLK
jgi:N,N'-diacetyllegionaminate synthase